MKRDKRIELAKEIAAETTKKFGHRTAHTASDLNKVELDVVPSGILSLDYVTGIGGYPAGFATEVYGPPDIGKSTIIGLGGIREAQKAGKLCGLIAMEPHFSEEWAVKHGVDPELLIVATPSSGEDAFAILHEWVLEGVPDFIVFDSIGGIPAPAKEPGTVKAFGASGIISAGLTNVAPYLWKNDVTLVLLNQVRDNTKAQIPGLVESPGGWALRHICPLRIQLKPGKDRYTTKVGTGKDAHNVLYGRSINAIIQRNKMAESSAPGSKAQFTFYHQQIEGEPFGLDIGKDVVAVGRMSKAIEVKGSFYSHPSFPGNHKLQGEEKVAEFVSANPEAYQAIRNDVLAAMMNRAEKPTLEAVKEGG